MTETYLQPIWSLGKDHLHGEVHELGSGQTSHHLIMKIWFVHLLDYSSAPILLVNESSYVTSSTVKLDLDLFLYAVKLKDTALCYVK